MATAPSYITHLERPNSDPSGEYELLLADSVPWHAVARRSLQCGFHHRLQLVKCDWLAQARGEAERGALM